uniref:TIL domain-containing protein n=1 Tax=Ascaris lumbricoides TaxID=6252 RepID=A0A0M3I1H7_ASCLU
MRNQPLNANPLQASVIGAQPHPGRCPELNEPPPANNDGCNWVVVADFRGCRTYVEECGQPNECTGEAEMLWKCSSECPPTCAEKWPGCGEQCGPPQCQCVGGYVRNHDGKCIKIFDCPTPQTQCAVNEVFSTCSKTCEHTCYTPMNIPCPSGCGPPRCECIEGYVRHNGACVSQDQCPSSRADEGDDPMQRALQQPLAHLCTLNEEFVECSSMCEPTCTSPPNQACTLACGPPKCQCREGFVRHRGQCILRSQCNAPECSSMCEPTCTSPPNQACTLACGPPKCQCREGFVRHRGQCILRSQCNAPGTCAENEIFSTCSSLCEPTCFTNPNARCPAVCGPPKCECRPGLVTNKPTLFVPFSNKFFKGTDESDDDPTLRTPQAPDSRRCGRNEEYVRCSSMCEPTCTSAPNQPCTLACGPSKCQCRPGYVRHRGDCIPRSQCSRPDRCRWDRDCPRFYECIRGYCRLRRQGGEGFNRGMEDEFGAVDEGPLLEKTLDMAEEQRVEETGSVLSAIKSGSTHPLRNPPLFSVLGFETYVDDSLLSCSYTYEKGSFARRCRSNRDCPRGYYCRNRYCYRWYYRDDADAVADAEAPLPEAHERAEQYKSCRSNSDCPRGYYCRVGRCYRQQYRDEADAVADPEVPFWEVNERADTPRCGNNEVYARCSSRCEPTCFSHPDENCGRACGPPKCECRSGYYRYQGRCVSRNQCPRLERCSSNSNCPRNYVCRGGWCYQSMRSWRSDDDTLPSDVIDEEPSVVNEQPANKAAFPLPGELICEKETQCPSGMDCINGLCAELQQANAGNATAPNQLKACNSENACEGDATCFEGFCHFVETKR